MWYKKQFLIPPSAVKSLSNQDLSLQCKLIFNGVISPPVGLKEYHVLKIRVGCFDESRPLGGLELHRQEASDWIRVWTGCKGEKNSNLSNGQ